MSEEDDELLGMFVQEASEHLETIEPDLLTLEENGDDTEPEIINRLFRGVHSIKGSAGFFGLTNITKLSHIMENLLGKVRERTMSASPAVTDSLLSGLDKLKAMIGDVSASGSVDASEEVRVIQAVLDGESSGAGGAAKADAKPAAEKPPETKKDASPPEDPVAQPAPEAEVSGEPPVAEAPPAPASKAAPKAAASKAAPKAAAPKAPPKASVPKEAVVSMSATAPVGAGFDLGNYSEIVADAIVHGRRFFLFHLDTEGTGPEKRVRFNQTKALLSSVGKVVDTDPAIAGDQDLEGYSGVVLDLLITTVLEEDLLVSLLQTDSSRMQRLEIPVDLARKVAPPKGMSPAEAARHAQAQADTTEKVVEAVVEEDVGFKPRLRRPDPGSVAIVTTGKGREMSGGGASKGGGPPAVEETLRVSVSLLDELINMAGELVLARNQMTRAAVEVQTQFPHFGPLIQNLDSITSRIQEKVMQARMQPVSVVFNKFPRIVRDLARKLEKKIDLEIRGGEVDLDKSVIEHLSDPLTHMIRNVADHAIELPQERTQIGKPEAGQVELAAYHENGLVNISLSDDGAGIDAERVKQKALERGQITERQADAMSEEDALSLIFAPGLSMAKKVSDVSGRGVGMDVVRTNIEKLGGTVSVQSKVGKGTTIILKLPLTLAIIPAMIVSSGNQRFAIPEIGLVEIVRIAESDRANQIETVGNAPVLRLRNMLLPLVDLADVLGVSRVWPPGTGSSDRRERLSDRRAQARKAREAARIGGSAGLAASSGLKEVPDRRDEPVDRRDPNNLVAYVMVLNVGGNEFGMVVDEVLDSEEIVVKPLPSYFKDNLCFSATTILGDGSVALIIDYAGLMEQAKINFSNVERATRMDLDEERRAALRERQNIILLETGTGLIMGIVHSMVRRVEKISPKLLDTIGGLPYVRYDGRTFRAVYPDQVMGLEGMGYSGGDPEEEGDADLCMVVPNIPNIQAGLIFSRIIDTRETHIDLDCRAIRAEGLFGSAQIDDRVVLFPDVNTVLVLAGIEMPHVQAQVDRTGLRALVVDDTPFLRALTSNYLQSVGFEVEQAEDGHVALTKLKNSEFDLLVTDLNMPGMDGFELAHEVPSTIHAEIPMIATTSSISSDVEQKCFKAGFVSCVPAIDKNRLLKVVSLMQER
ncbi:MAG: hybrid sensor histidine kinase/response regulator [Magnetococcales bacterium]|nr:hybrid sensor histidine kinase/response regulator [Magnetococcales bacterium]HIJ83368.1 response regulator [Magnetococcales bacterium]